MASILEYINFEDDKSVKFENLQVKIKLEDGTSQIVKLGALEYKQKLNKFSIRDYETFSKHRNGKLFYLNKPITIGKTEKVVFSVDSKFRPEITSTTIDFTEERKAKFDDDKDIVIQNGVRRTLSATGKKLSKNDNYIMIQMLSSKKVLYVKKSEITYHLGSANGNMLDYLNGSMTTSDLNNFIKNNKFSYKGKIIKSINVSKEFAFDKIESFDQIDEDSLKRKTVILNEPEKKGKVDKYSIVAAKEEDIDPYYSVQNYITVKEQVKDSTETKDVSKIKVRNFQVAKDGEYIKVRLKGDLIQSMVKLSDLHPIEFSTEKISASNIKDYVGQAVKVKQADGSFIASEPLTYEQTAIKYNSIKSFEPSNDINKVEPLAENAYLRLANGKYILESEVARPIAYKFLKESTPDSQVDAYCVLVKDSNPAKYVIVTKEFFDKQTTIEATLKDGKVLDLKNFRKLQRTSNILTCDVIQSSSKGEDVEACKILSPIGSAKRVSELETSEEAFKTGYKAGSYKLNTVFNEEGKLCEIDKTKAERFAYTDEFLVDDHTTDTSAKSLSEAFNKLDYQALKTNTIIYDENAKTRFGRFKYLNGGPKYDVAKANAKAFGIWGKLLGYSCAGMCTGACILVGLALPVAVATFAVGMVAAVPAIPIVNAWRGWRRNRDKTVISNKVDIQRNQDKREIEEQLKFLLEKANEFTKDMKKSGKKLSADKITDFEERFNDIQKRIIMMSRSNINLKFEMKNGKCEVTPETAHYIQKFRQQNNEEFKKLKHLQDKIQSKNDKLKKLKKDSEKFKTLKEEINELQLEHEERKATLDSKMKNYIETAAEKEIAPYRDELQDKVDTAKALMYLKCVHRDKDKIRDAEINNDLIDKNEVLDKLDYDVEKGVLLFKGKSIEKLKNTNPNKLKNEEKIILQKIANIEEAIKTIKEKGLKQTKDELIEKPFKELEEDVAIDLGEDLEEIEEDIEEVVEDEYLAYETVDPKLDEELAEVIEEEVVPEDKAEEKDKEEKDSKASKKSVGYDVKIVSEDALVQVLVANKESKDRKKLISYISKKAGVEISEKDISDTVKTIDRRHKNNKNARAGAHRFTNKNICVILDYGQEYLTNHAIVIKDKIVRDL